jgi:hypothetical protein
MERGETIMSDEMMLKIAEVLFGDLDPKERRAQLAEIMADPEGVETLSLAYVPGMNQWLKTELPFATSLFCAGVSCGYLSLLHLDGFDIQGIGPRIANLFRKLSARVLRLCLPRHVRFSTIHEEGLPPVEMALDLNREGYYLTIHNQSRENLRFELWEGNSLLRITPVNAQQETTLSGLTLEKVYSWRLSKADRGISICLLPIEFGMNEWLSALIGRVVTGQLPEAIEILNQHLLPRLESDPTTRLGTPTSHQPLRRILACLKAIGSISKNTSGVLFPVPLMRNGISTLSEYQSDTSTVDKEGEINKPQPMEALLLFQPVWEGLQQICPGLSDLANPWEQGSQVIDWSHIPPSFRELAQTTLVCIWTSRSEGILKVVCVPPEQETQDPVVRSGWLALQAWTQIARQDYQTAEEILQQVPVDQNDLFGIQTALSLVNHFLLTESIEKQGTGLSSEIHSCGEENPPYRVESDPMVSSCDRIYREIFAPLFRTENTN